MAQLPIADRIGLIAPSITLQINDQVKRLKESGSDVISFCVGEPNFPTPPAIAQVASQAALDPANHRYTATKGLPEFRQAIAAKTLRDSGYRRTSWSPMGASRPSTRPSKPWSTPATR